MVPVAAARAMILSSMSVMFDTNTTSNPRHWRYRRIMSKVYAVRAWPTWGSSYTVGPHTYIDTRPGTSGSNGTTFRRRVS